METDNLKVVILDNDKVKINEIDNVSAIRIKDNNYNLLIMKDYWPLLGEINGSIIIEANNAYDYKNIKGFYTLSHNIFHLIILEKEEENDW